MLDSFLATRLHRTSVYELNTVCNALPSSGSVLECLGVSWSVWAYLGVSRSVLECLGVSWSVWAYPGLSRSVLECLGVSGSVWECLRVSGSVWACLRVSGSVCECLHVSGSVMIRTDGIRFDALYCCSQMLSDLHRIAMFIDSAQCF